MRRLPLYLLGLTPALACTGANGPGDDVAISTETGDPVTTAEGSEPECRGNTDCPPHSYCVEGICEASESPEVDECYEHADCPEGLCVDYRCVPDVPRLDACEAIELVGTEVFTLIYPHVWAVGDVDGQPGDEIVAYHQGEIVSIAAGVPTISPHPVPYGGVGAALILQADEDGKPDLLVSGSSLGLRTFMGDGTGAFSYSGQRHFDFEIYRLARAAAPGSDALIAREGGPEFGHHVFVDALASAPALTLASEVDPVTGDLDGDGIDEVALVRGEEVQLWAREGDGYALAHTLDCQIEGQSLSLPVVVPAIADVNADGLADLVCFAALGDSIAITLHESVGGLEFSRQPTVRIVGQVYKATPTPVAAAADLTGEGAPVLVFGDRFLRLGADGNFDCEGQIVSSVAMTGPIRVGDVDVDGRDELVTVSVDHRVWIHDLL